MGCSYSVHKYAAGSSVGEESPKSITAGLPAPKVMQFGPSIYDNLKPDPTILKRVASEKLLLDAHCHYLNFLQQTEGLDGLAKAMERNKVGFSVLTGCPFKKTWVRGLPLGSRRARELTAAAPRLSMPSSRSRCAFSCRVELRQRASFAAGGARPGGATASAL